jgi:hypothetical protein
MLGVHHPHFRIFRYASGSFLVNWGPKKSLLLTTRLAEKNFPPKNLIYYFKKVLFFFPPLTTLRYRTSSYQMSFLLYLLISTSYQMSLPLLSADAGTRWTRTAEPWVSGPSFCPLDLD